MVFSGSKVDGQLTNAFADDVLYGVLSQVCLVCDFLVGQPVDELQFQYLPIARTEHPLVNE